MTMHRLGGRYIRVEVQASEEVVKGGEKVKVPRPTVVGCIGKFDETGIPRAARTGGTGM